MTTSFPIIMVNSLASQTKRFGILAVVLIAGLVLAGCTNATADLSAEGWVNDADGAWQDSMGNDIRYSGGQVSWRRAGEQDWRSSNGVWESSPGLWLKLDSERVLWQSGDSNGPWERVKSKVWTSNGSFYRFNENGMLVSK